MTPALDDLYVTPVKDRIGAIDLMLSDQNGTAAGMSSSGTLRILDAAGNVIGMRNGDPKTFMPVAWQNKVKVVLDELRAAVTTRIIG